MSIWCLIPLLFSPVMKEARIVEVDKANPLACLGAGGSRRRQNRYARLDGQPASVPFLWRGLELFLACHLPRLEVRSLAFHLDETFRLSIFPVGVGHSIPPVSLPTPLVASPHTCCLPTQDFHGTARPTSYVRTSPSPQSERPSWDLGSFSQKIRRFYQASDQ